MPRSGRTISSCCSTARGPTSRELADAADKVAAGGLFGYRFYYPPMRVGQHEVFWQRPLVAYLSADNEPAVAGRCAARLSHGLSGRQAAAGPARSSCGRGCSIARRIGWRSAVFAAITISAIIARRSTSASCWTPRACSGRGPLPRDLARSLLTLPKHETLDDWLASLPERAVSAEVGQRVQQLLSECIAPADAGKAARRRRKTAKPAKATAGDGRPASLTFARTAKRSFEKAYWNLIASLATGQYINKDNADCVPDAATQAKLVHSGRDLEALGDHLLDYYRKLLERMGMTDQVLVGEVPFRWQTDFRFPGWAAGSTTSKSKTYERDLLVVIPGRDRTRAVIMADHYDTAYMEDVFGYAHGGKGPRLAAAGADDNHSATAALMLGAESFLKLSQAGKLDCDVWLVHLTGEEFPSDCMGARHLCQKVVEGTLAVRTADGKSHDLSKTRVAGVYVLDMVAHNNDHDRDVFQMCPGTHRQSMWLAWQAHQATETWNASVPLWNARPERKGLGARPAQHRRQRCPTWPLHLQLERRGSAAVRSAQHALQHRRADFFRRRRAGRAVHGELRHQPQGLSRHARHAGEHRPGLRLGRGGDRHRIGRPGGQRRKPPQRLTAVTEPRKESGQRRKERGRGRRRSKIDLPQLKIHARPRWKGAAGVGEPCPQCGFHFPMTRKPPTARPCFRIMA